MTVVEESPGGSVVPSGDDPASAFAEYARLGAHVRRYRWAGGLAQNRTVLDLGCGHGFGATELAPRAKSYLGVDTDTAAIAWADRVLSPRYPNARFASPASHSTLGSFELVVCFEVIEHVSDPVALLRTVRSALAPGGFALLSTPNGAVSGGRQERYRSRFHVREYTAPEVAQLLEAAQLSGEFFKQRRWDRLDALALRWGMASVAQRERPGATSRGFAWFARHFDGPAFWSLRPSEPERMGGRGYSSIAVRIRAPASVQVPPRA